MKTRSSVILVVFGCAYMVVQGCRQPDTLVPSVNVVGSHQTASLLGAVVQLRNSGNFAECIEQKEPVILKNVQCSGEFGGFHAGKFVAHDWITSQAGYEVGGTVESVTIDGTCVDLLQKTFTNGCLVTRDY